MANIPRYVLRKPVRVQGPDYFGRPALVVLKPTHRPGWYWEFKSGQEPVAISERLITALPRHLALVLGQHRMHVFEHLGALRFTGLDSIVVASKTAWLPYDGCARQMWEAVKPLLRHEGFLKPTPLSRPVLARGNNGRRYVQMLPNSGSDKFLASVYVNYRGVGEGRALMEIPTQNLDAWDVVFNTPGQGWPPILRPVARIAANLGIWRHPRAVTWPQEHTPADTARLFARHRLFDFLGGLSVALPAGGMFTGNAHSMCGGHFLDVDLVQSMSS